VSTRNASRVAVKDAPFIPGSMCWVNVSATDTGRSQRFYSELFGCTYQIASGPGRRRYMTASRNGHPVAWTLYLASRNVKRTAQLLGK
jgi:predicted enzyme related to lactoylglutathione lyase